MTVNSKRKGGSFEREIARELSSWMFSGDDNVLKRHPSSGADKCILCGDVIPLKPLNDSICFNFPFLVECKTGYPDNSPTFWNYKIIEEWYIKAKKEGQLTNQNIVFLICRFKNKKKLLITDTDKFCKSVNPKVIIPIEATWCYVYMYDDILNLDFSKIFRGENAILRDGQ